MVDVPMSMLYVICLCIYTMCSPSMFCIENFVIYICCLGVILTMHLNYIFVCIDTFYMFVHLINSVCIDSFVHIITVSVFLCLCTLYNLIVGYTSPWYFVLYFSCAWVIPSLRKYYIFFVISIFVYVIYMGTVICLCSRYDMLLGCATSW